MSIATYTELRSQLKAWTRETDIDAVFDSMIELVEAQIYSGKQPLRVLEMVATAQDDFPISDRTMPLPDYYLEMIKCELKDEWELMFIPVQDMPVDAPDGKPTRYTITDKIKVDSVPDTNYFLYFTYFKKFPKLTEALGTNTILTNYPQIYFSGLKAQIYDYAGEPELAALHRAEFDALIAGANHKYKTGSFGSNLRMSGTFFRGGYHPPVTMKAR